MARKIDLCGRLDKFIEKNKSIEAVELFRIPVRLEFGYPSAFQWGRSNGDKYRLKTAMSVSATAINYWQQIQRVTIGGAIIVVAVFIFGWMALTRYADTQAIWLEYNYRASAIRSC